MAVAGVSLSLLLPAVQMARQSARTMQDKNNLRQLGLAIQNHESAHRHFPTNGDPYESSRLGGSVRESSIVKSLLPFLEQSNIEANYDKEGWHFSVGNEALTKNGGASVFAQNSFPGSSDLPGRMDVGFIAGADVMPKNFTNLEPWSGNDWQVFVTGDTLDKQKDPTGVFHQNPKAHARDPRPVPKTRLQDIYDGTSNTAIIGVNGGSVASDKDFSTQVTYVNPGYARISGKLVKERKGGLKPEDPQILGIGMKSDGTTLFTFADGHVESINVRDMDDKVLRSIITIAGGEVIDQTSLGR
jgi:type II secretory pathway pseudopilin PulG